MDVLGVGGSTTGRYLFTVRSRDPKYDEKVDVIDGGGGGQKITSIGHYP